MSRTPPKSKGKISTQGQLCPQICVTIWPGENSRHPHLPDKAERKGTLCTATPGSWVLTSMPRAPGGCLLLHEDGLVGSSPGQLQGLEEARSTCPPVHYTPAGTLPTPHSSPGADSSQALHASPTSSQSQLCPLPREGKGQRPLPLLGLQGLLLDVKRTLYSENCHTLSL